jgi:hypothetical protein
MDPIRSAAHIERAAHYMGMAQRAQSAFGARLPIAHTPAYLRDSQTTGRMHPMKLALPDDCARLKKIVASVINVDKDAGFYTAAYGPIQTWNTSHVTSMSHMFQLVKQNAPAQNLDLSEWDTSNVRSMKMMLAQLPEQVKVTGFGSWDTSNVEDMSYMFFVAKGVRLDTDSQNMMMKWNTSKVKSMYNMFKQTGEISEWGGNKGEHHYLVDFLTQGWDNSSVESGKEYNA